MRSPYIEVSCYRNAHEMKNDMQRESKYLNGKALVQYFLVWPQYHTSISHLVQLFGPILRLTASEPLLGAIQISMV